MFCNKVIEITNLWIQVNMNTKSDNFWYLDYEKGFAKLYAEKPKHESIRKWPGTIDEFFTQRGTEIVEKKDDTIKFKPEKY